MLVSELYAIQVANWEKKHGRKWEGTNMEQIGHLDNQDNINAILGSIVDTDKDSFNWVGTEDGIELVINGHQIFIKNDENIAAKAFELYQEVKV